MNLIVAKQQACSPMGNLHLDRDLIFEPGITILHRSNVAHAARPITNRERSNLV